MVCNFDHNASDQQRQMPVRRESLETLLTLTLLVLPALAVNGLCLALFMVCALFGGLFDQHQQPEVEPEPELQIPARRSRLPRRRQRRLRQYLTR